MLLSTPTEPGFTGVVLAGGQSRRMGRDKCELIWQQEPLWIAMQDKLCRAGARRVIVCGPQAGDNCWADVLPQLGPLGGLLTLAQRAADGVHLVVPVDMPALAADHLRVLVQVLSAAPAAALCAFYTDHYLPLALRLNDVSRAAIKALSAGERRERSIRQLCHLLNGSELPAPADAFPSLANCNTPAQWQAMQAAVRSTP